MRLYTNADKDRMMRHIWEYEKRRKNYRNQLKNATNKIKEWKRVMTRVEERTNKLLAINNALATFCGISVRNTANHKSARALEAKRIFYKYCLEHDISATLIAEFVGVRRGDTISDCRRNFNKSFVTNPEKRELYTRFERYINDLSNN